MAKERDKENYNPTGTDSPTLQDCLDYKSYVEAKKEEEEFFASLSPNEQKDYYTPPSDEDLQQIAIEAGYDNFTEYAEALEKENEEYLNSDEFKENERLKEFEAEARAFFYSKLDTGFLDKFKSLLFEVTPISERTDKRRIADFYIDLSTAFTEAVKKISEEIIALAPGKELKRVIKNNFYVTAEMLEAFNSAMNRDELPYFKALEKAIFNQDYLKEELGVLSEEDAYRNFAEALYWDYALQANKEGVYAKTISDSPHNKALEKALEEAEEEIANGNQQLELPFGEDETTQAGEVIAKSESKAWKTISKEESLLVASKMAQLPFRKPIIGAGLVDVGVSYRNKGITNSMQAVFLQADFTGNSHEGYSIKGVQKLSRYEQTVANALMTLWARGKDYHIFSLNMLYRTVSHSPNTNAPKKTKDKLREILKRFQNLEITIIATDEFKTRNITIGDRPVESWEKTSRMFNLGKGRAKINGNWTEEAYWFESSERPPIMLEYSSLVKQISTHPNERYQISEYIGGTWQLVSSTEDRAVIIEDLLTQIRIMKGDPATKEGGTIILKELYERTELDFYTYDKQGNPKLDPKTGKPLEDRKKVKEARDFVLTTLECWKNKQGFIKDYEAVTKGKSIVAVRIHL